MQSISAQPIVRVGLIGDAKQVSVRLNGAFRSPKGLELGAGDYLIEVRDGGITLGDHGFSDLVLSPVSNDGLFLVRDVVIGVEFHWQRKQDQLFSGPLRVRPNAGGGLVVINEIPVETYLTSVIASEMSALAHPELLKAHAVISRSWLLAQLQPWKKPGRAQLSLPQQATGQEHERIRWYDREDHLDFDVCADDHCQRYQGAAKSTTQTVLQSINETAGLILISGESDGEDLCDTRFSKSCGGVSENFSAAWDSIDAPYLQPVYDGADFPQGFSLPLSAEANAAAWIKGAPPAFCNVAEKSILEKILPDFDQETVDFFRWTTVISQEELQELLKRKLGLEAGVIRELEALERGASGRIIRLKILADQRTLILGKELEIRRALSPTHLYSSAFIVESDEQYSKFVLRGAGWGHGVGLCQIGAAVMAERGYDYRQILEHYYRGAHLFELYK
jgi:stage II sporulation protein D